MAADRPGGWGPLLVLVGAVTAARLAYLVFLCPYALIEDEAHYWEWSRHLDWSYYSKGPGIAWLIRGMTAIFGEGEAAIRCAAPMLGGITAVAGAGLARDITGSARAGVFAAACFLLAPIFQVSSLLMTVDGPYLAAWSLACWAGWRALAAGRPRAWPALGAAIGAGLLFKYTMLLLIPGLLMFLWMDRGRNGRAVGWAGPGAALAIIAASAAPMIGWNALRGWPGVQHLLGHLGVRWGDMPVDADAAWRYDPAWTLEFVAVQAVILGPVLYLGIVGLVRAMRSAEAGARRGAWFLLSAGLPIAMFHLALTAMTRVEGNWAIAAYLTLLPAAGWAAGMPGGRAARRLWIASLAVGGASGVLMLRLDWVSASPPTAWIHRSLAWIGVKPDGPLVPIGRLMAGPVLAADAARLGAELRGRTGLEPFFIADHYGRASLLAYYLPGRPTVYCSSSMLGEGRRTQYDFWESTDLGDLSRLGGRPAVCLGKTRERWEGAFVAVEERGRLAGEPKRDRLVFLGLGYRGFAPAGAGPP